MSVKTSLPQTGIASEKKMTFNKLSFITSTFPPRFCGVGDHTARLAAELAGKLEEVKVLTAFGEVHNPRGVSVGQFFSNESPRSIMSLPEAIAVDKPDWVVIQYDPFSYGARYGFNPYLPLMAHRLKRRCPQVRLALIVHESFVPVHNWKSRVLSLELKAQLWALGRAADAIFTATEPWVERLSAWFPKKMIKHLPVGSNIPLVVAEREEVRASLGIRPETNVLGLFGRVQRTRSMEHVRSAVRRAREAGLDVAVLYMGLDSAAAREHLRGVPLITNGPLSPEEVSRCLAAVDVYLVPIDEGVSTRRTTLMSGLQHGLATVATIGSATDRLLARENGKALLLAEAVEPEAFAEAVRDLLTNAERRERLSDGARSLFSREFDWQQIAAAFLATLNSCAAQESPSSKPRNLTSQADAEGIGIL